MSNFKKPQTPLYDAAEDYYFYPLTTADQVILEDGNRLNTVIPDIKEGFMAVKTYDPNSEGIDVTIQTYSHTKSETVHEFTGVGQNGKVKITANVEAGDTFTVNGNPVSAKIGADNAVDVMAGNDYIGRWMTFVYDSEDNTLNFKGGGGGKVTVDGLSAGIIKSGAIVTIKQGTKVIQSVTGSYSPSTALITIPNKSGYVSTNTTATLTFSNVGKNFTSVYMDVEIRNWGAKANCTGTVIAYIDNVEVDRKTYTRKAGTSAYVRVFAFKANTFFDLSRMKVTVHSTDNNEIYITGKGVQIS